MIHAHAGPLGLGLIGCGLFGEYCMEEYSRLPGLRPVATADATFPNAQRVATRFGVPALFDAADLVARQNVDLVHIATPPASHHELAMLAIAASKHVLCEKPLALRPVDAEAVVSSAATKDLIAPVNFVLRYTATAQAVERIIASGVLGAPLHAAFENFAQDETLGPDHWFWDPAVSGGIFIEHAVHFFDLYAAWLGPARVVAACAQRRPGSAAEDRVTCVTRHDSGALVYQYHGFDQAYRMDRQTHHLLFELGDIHVFGWVPESLTLTALVNENSLEKLTALLEGPDVQVLARYDEPAQQAFRARWTDRRVTRKVRISWNPGLSKDALYRQAIGALMADQLAYIADRSHRRRVTEANGLAALELAAAATTLAHAPPPPPHAPGPPST